MALSPFRRDLLKLIGVREFSLEAAFKDPCQSLILPEVHLYMWGGAGVVRSCEGHVTFYCLSGDL